MCFDVALFKLKHLSIVLFSRLSVRFSKVPKLYGLFSGVTIPSVSQEWRGFGSSNFTGSLLTKDVFKITRSRITVKFDDLNPLVS